jgi:hypothetical protein
MNVSCECCQVEVSAKVGSLTQRSPTECGMSESARQTSITRRSWSTRGIRAMERKKLCHCISPLTSAIDEGGW